MGLESNNPRLALREWDKAMARFCGAIVSVGRTIDANRVLDTWNIERDAAVVGADEVIAKLERLLGRSGAVLDPSVREELYASAAAFKQQSGI